MSAKLSAKAESGTVVARNPRARHDYHILDTWEVGIILTGSEIKSIRAGKVSLKGAFGVVRSGELWLEGMNITPYESGGYANHDPTRSRKLLMHRHELRRLIGSVEQKGLTLVPLDLHLADGWAKLNLALGQGKKLYDKREDLKRRAAERDAQRARGRRG
ncbi:MAG: SsrA-binding protein SmpB [Gemmatimonadales bacterium]|nr:SsrA-binding protein SmpB [Gemmatimonadales bacterium]